MQTKIIALALAALSATASAEWTWRVEPKNLVENPSGAFLTTKASNLDHFPHICDAAFVVPDGKVKESYTKYDGLAYDAQQEKCLAYDDMGKGSRWSLRTPFATKKAATDMVQLTYDAGAINAKMISEGVSFDSDKGFYMIKKDQLDNISIPSNLCQLFYITDNVEVTQNTSEEKKTEAEAAETFFADRKNIAVASNVAGRCVASSVNDYSKYLVSKNPKTVSTENKKTMDVITDFSAAFAVNDKSKRSSLILMYEQGTPDLPIIAADNDVPSLEEVAEVLAGKSQEKVEQVKDEAGEVKNKVEEKVEEVKNKAEEKATA